ncbi:MAG: hypothetical protein L7V15_01870, partial [Burkholderiales bacterium]|nr:hypothetical protein [Burkholderiales bacterium]
MKAFPKPTIISMLTLVFLTWHASCVIADDKQGGLSTISHVGFLEEKAKSGDIKTQLRLGTMYRDGQGVPRNSQKSFYWFL